MFHITHDFARCPAQMKARSGHRRCNGTARNYSKGVRSGEPLSSAVPLYNAADDWKWHAVQSLP